MSRTGTFRRFLGLLRPHTGALVAAGAGMLGVAFFTVQLAALIRPLFDRYLAAGGSTERVWHLPLLLLAYYLGKGACSYVATVLAGRVGQEAVAGLRQRVHRAVLGWPLGGFTSSRTGDLLSRILVDVERLETAISEKLSQLVREGFVVLALAGWLFYLDPFLALTSILAAPLVVGALVAFGRRIRGASRRSQGALGSLAAIFQESLQGIRVVKAFAMEGFEAERLARISREIVRINLRAIRTVALTPPLMELVGGAAAGAVFVYGSGRIGAGGMTVGGFTSFLTTLLLMYTPVKKISNANNFLQQSLAAAERVFEVLDAPREPQRRPGDRPLGPPRSGILFERVWFRYGEDWVLRDLDLFIRPGEIVALVGESGAGKSTIANLLLRFFEPERGRILWDDTDLRRARLDRLREQISLVTQETFLFHDTVARNVAYGREDVDRDEIERVARLANAHGFISRLPRGYDTLVGERGERLSQGQRQRLTIARALLKRAPVLILDEATSSLDVETEEEVRVALERLMERRTVLWIAHRLSTVRRADRIVVLEGGRITESGPHHELLGRSGVYARMHRKAVEEP